MLIVTSRPGYDFHGVRVEDWILSRDHFTCKFILREPSSELAEQCGCHAFASLVVTINM